MVEKFKLIFVIISLVGVGILYCSMEENERKIQKRTKTD